MLCTWTGSYLYEVGKMENDAAIVCEALINELVKRGKSDLIIKKTVSDEWERRHKPIDVEQHYIKNFIDDSGKLTKIEDAAEIILDCYEEYMNDEASNFGEYGYMFEPYEKEDLECFVEEYMINII